MRHVNEDERALLQHVERWGSDGYPVSTHAGRRNRWRWSFRSLGSPTLYKTKRETIAALERFLDVLREALGEEAQARALEEQARRRLTAD